MNCPNCQAGIQSRSALNCPLCECNLSPLQHLLSNADNLFNTALSACHQSDWLTAIECLAKAELLNPGDSAVITLLGKVYLELQSIDKAYSCFARAVQKDFQNIEAQEALKWCLKNRLLHSH
ncbi:MAG TPA: tetratricopeptide repeat protein [bacterium]|jgi:tetratricopeptide (TPR) repeat protein|nr:tetratricopeptide repeat protein [bacterium]